MRVYRTGLDANGASTIVGSSEHAGPVAERVSTIILETPFNDRRSGVGEGSLGDQRVMDVGLSPGTTSWRLVEFLPDQDLPWHKTESVDVDVIVSGTVEFGVEQQTVTLGVGDVVVVDGVMHRWHAGPEGCRILASLIADS